MRRFFRFYWPAVGWTIIILLLTLFPASDIPDTPLNGIPHFDKLVHAGIFGVFVILWYGALFRSLSASAGREMHRSFPLTLLARVILVAVFLGFLIEVIQKDWKFIHRDFDWYDWLADILGAFFGGAVANELFRAKLPAKK
jgi:VanZ family protein